MSGWLRTDRFVKNSKQRCFAVISLFVVGILLFPGCKVRRRSISQAQGRIDTFGEVAQRIYLASDAAGKPRVYWVKCPETRNPDGSLVFDSDSVAVITHNECSHLDGKYSEYVDLPFERHFARMVTALNLDGVPISKADQEVVATKLARISKQMKELEEIGAIERGARFEAEASRLRAAHRELSDLYQRLEGNRPQVDLLNRALVLLEPNVHDRVNRATRVADILLEPFTSGPTPLKPVKSAVDVSMRLLDGLDFKSPASRGAEECHATVIPEYSTRGTLVGAVYSESSGNGCISVKVSMECTEQD